MKSMLELINTVLQSIQPNKYLFISVNRIIEVLIL